MLPSTIVHTKRDDDGAVIAVVAAVVAVAAVVVNGSAEDMTIVMKHKICIKNRLQLL